MSKKVCASAEAAMAEVKASGVLRDGAQVMVGGFGLCGIPEHLIIALRDTGVKELTCISNNAGVDDWGLGLLLQTKQIKKMISSYVGENDTFAQQFLNGELEVEFNPQGTLAERVRAGGAGIPGFFTPTGAGTQIAEGKETRMFVAPRDARSGGAEREYVFETGLFADVALVKAEVGDTAGNLVFNKTARNFNPEMATAATVTIAEVEKIVPAGAIDPDDVHLVGAFVNHIVEAQCEKRIEQRTTRQA